MRRCSTRSIQLRPINALVLLAMLLPGLWSARPGQAQVIDDTEAPLVEATLLSDVAAIAPGSTLHLGVRFRIEKGWSIYWRNPGSSGLATTLEVEAPSGLNVGDVRWPGPKRKEGPGGLLDYVYEKEAILIIPIETADSLEPGTTVEIRILASWLACKGRCVLGEQELSLTLPVTAKASPSAEAALIRQQEARMPRPLEELEEAHTIRWNGDSLVISMPGAKRLTFFPHESDDWELIDPIAHGAAEADRLRLPIDFGLDEPTLEITGVLAITDDEDHTVHVTIASAREPEAH